jgi:hypothetical protein
VFRKQLASQLKLSSELVSVTGIVSRNSRRVLEMDLDLVKALPEGASEDDGEVPLWERHLSAPALVIGPSVPKPSGTVGFYQISYFVLTPFLQSGVIATKGLSAIDVFGRIDPNVLFSEAPYIKFYKLVQQNRVGRKCVHSFLIALIGSFVLMSAIVLGLIRSLN